MNNPTSIARYALRDRIHYGVVEGDRLRRLATPPFEGLVETGDLDPLPEARLLAPVERPRIFGAAYNYREHTREAGKKEPEAPVIFMKPSTAAGGAIPSSIPSTERSFITKANSPP